MDRLNAMAMFSTVMECGSFSAAARKLNKPQTTVSRQVKELEDYLGVQLVRRSTRNLVLTDAGRKYLQSCREVLSMVTEIERDAKGEYREPKGCLTVTAPHIMGRMHVFPLLTEYLHLYADVSVKLLLTDQNLHMYEDVVDVAFRVGDLPDSELVAKSLGSVQKILCASPQYLAKHGVPTEPADLEMHQCITFEGLDSASQWRFNDDGKEILTSVFSRVRANSIDVSIQAAREGLGIARVLSYQALPWLLSGELKLVLQRFAPSSWPVNLLYIQQPVLPLKQRSFIDFITPRMQARFEQFSQEWSSFT
ncbi:LysR family transcriptional regulator [Alteromonas sediminis]|uniref:LysR family transcriptional regulator n=1 Tax=Alteromonas sediminis TaxID=2259342 RepID=A0A3N5Y0W3_9ALTE|nr:LysR family transcriptional regulator [Alteromonas sediminis]RPJ66553.1 LysR family transcriptional regulator [Alteromonas sediminis]